MSKGRLSRLTRSAPNLEIPANETRAEAVHHGLLAIAIPQLVLAHPVAQRLSADRAQLSIPPSETKNERVTGDADSVQDLDRLH